MWRKNPRLGKTMSRGKFRWCITRGITWGFLNRNGLDDFDGNSVVSSMVGSSRQISGNTRGNLNHQDGGRQEKGLRGDDLEMRQLEGVKSGIVDVNVPLLESGPQLGTRFCEQDEFNAIPIADIDLLVLLSTYHDDTWLDVWSNVSDRL